MQTFHATRSKGLYGQLLSAKRAWRATQGVLVFAPGKKSWWTFEGGFGQRTASTQNADFSPEKWQADDKHDFSLSWKVLGPSLVINGVPGGIRTPNLLIRSQKLYPVELQAQMRDETTKKLNLASPKR